MGDPRKQRKKYAGPSHPWQKLRLEEESQYIKEYGLKNKKEIWRAQSLLRHFGILAKKLVGLTSEEAEKEALQMVQKLNRQGILAEGSNLNDILSVSVKAILDRRVQTLLYRKGIARSVKQARQFITHGHVYIGNTKVSSPSYLVMREEEDKICINSNSSLFDTEHPERVVIKTEKKTSEEPKVHKKQRNSRSVKNGKK